MDSLARMKQTRVLLSTLSALLLTLSFSGCAAGDSGAISTIVDEIDPTTVGEVTAESRYGGAWYPDADPTYVAVIEGADVEAALLARIDELDFVKQDRANDRVLVWTKSVDGYEVQVAVVSVAAGEAADLGPAPSRTLVEDGIRLTISASPSP